MKPIRAMPAAALAVAAAALPAAAHEVICRAFLTGPSEALPSGSAGLGAAIITFDLGLFTIQITFAGLCGNVTASDIHCRTTTRGTGTVGVATRTPNFLDFPARRQLRLLRSHLGHEPGVELQRGVRHWQRRHGQHSVHGAAERHRRRSLVHEHPLHVCPGGEIRGFLVPIPEPGSCGLTGAGLPGLGMFMRRRRAA